MKITVKTIEPRKNKILFESSIDSVDGKFAIEADDRGYLRQLNDIIKQAQEAAGKTIDIKAEQGRLEGGRVVNNNTSDKENQKLMAELAGKFYTDNGTIQAEADEDAKKAYDDYMFNKASGNILLGNWDSFLNSMTTTIKQQLELEIPYNTYARKNHHNDEDKTDTIRRPGVDTYTLSSRPTIDIYLDQSYSWRNTTAEKIGNELVTALREMDKNNAITINLLFFANKIHASKEPCWHENGTKAWELIQKDILAKKASNVMIITDYDMGRQGTHGMIVTPPGNIWYI